MGITGTDVAIIGGLTVIAAIGAYFILVPQAANGTQNNPYDYTLGWQGAGWYINVPNNTSAVDILTQTQYASYTATTTPTGTGTQSNPYDYNAGYQGPGYYTNVPGNTAPVDILTKTQYDSYQPVVAKGTISVSSTTIKVNSNGTYSPSSIAISGSGFSYPLTSIYIKDENDNTVAVGVTGILSGSFKVITNVSSYYPQIGTGYLVAQDSSNGQYSNEVSMTYVAASAPTLSPPSQTITLPGTFTLTGTGYTPGGTVTVTTYTPTTGTSISPTNFTAKSDGSFTTGAQTMPSVGVAGTATFGVTATDESTGNVSNSVTITFVSTGTGTSIPPQVMENLPIYMSPNSVSANAAGYSILVYGTGMAAFSTVMVSCTEGSYLVGNMSAGQCNLNGAWQINNYTVPYVPGAPTALFQAVQSDNTRYSAVGTLTITSPTITTPTGSITLTPSIAMSPTSFTATAGNTITMTGSNFTKGGTVNIICNNYALASTTADTATGNFSWTSSPLSASTNLGFEIGVCYAEGLTSLPFEAYDVSTCAYSNIVNVPYTGSL